MKPYYKCEEYCTLHKNEIYGRDAFKECTQRKFVTDLSLKSQSFNSGC